LRQDIISGGVLLIILGIILVFSGNYLSNPMNYPYNILSGESYSQMLMQIQVGGILSFLGIIFLILGIILVPVGVVVLPDRNQKLQNNYQNLYQPIKSNIQANDMICGECGYSISFDAKFCPNCGKKFIKSIKTNFCPNCGVGLDGSPDFCFNCGYRLR
jgi:uncharacterized membrane protein